jgi:hypothetical protein
MIVMSNSYIVISNLSMCNIKYILNSYSEKKKIKEFKKYNNTSMDIVKFIPL